MTPPLMKPLIFVLALAPLASADFNCQGSSFLSATVLGKTPDKAREKAKAEIARNIVSNIKSSTRMTDYSEEKNGVMRESSSFLETSEIESSLTLFGFQEAEPPKRQKNGEYEIKVYICAKDAAKSFLERQRLVADSLELASGMALNARQSKNKNEAFRKTQMLWGELVRTQSVLEVLGVESEHFASAKESYEKAREDYREHRMEIESMTVFVGGTESIQEQATNIIIPRLQTMLSESKVTVTERQGEASHILSIESRVCNPRADEHFHYASACIKAVLTNAKTGRNELTITVNGRKEGGLNEYDAGERAFKSAFPELWSKIKDKIMEIIL
jgi:hypothetical protein